MQELLARCCNSLLVKNNLDFLEVLVINDGSKDNSLQIALEYNNKYPTIFKIIDKENGNYGSCINRGLKESTGKYIKILDADDYYDIIELDKLLEKLKTSNSDLIFTPYTTREYNLEINSTFTIDEKYLNKEFKQDSFSFEIDNLYELRRMHCMCVKSSILKENNYYQTEGISYTDSQFVFYSFLFGKTITILNYNIYQYCLGRDGQTMSPASMIKNNLHFYQNAKRLLIDYSNIDVNESQNKICNLQTCIKSEFVCYTFVIFNLCYKNKTQIYLFNELIELGKSSNIPYYLEKECINNTNFTLWKNYRINPFFLIWKDKFINYLQIIKKRIFNYRINNLKHV